MSTATAITQALDRVLVATHPHLRTLDPHADRYVVFSDHHKGQRDGADDFARCEASYLTALEHYFATGYTLILLGDAEELWENRVEPVLAAYANVLAAERQFLPGRLVKIWGNHDDEWESPRRIAKHLPPVFGTIEVPEGVQFQVVRRGEVLGTLLLLHGHQGTLFSDRLAGVAKLAVRFVWRTIQRITRRPSTTPANDAWLRKHCALTFGLDGPALTDLGRAVLAAMTRHRVLGDVSHCTPAARAAIYAELDASRPIVASHIGVRQLNPDPYDLANDEIREIARRGGAIGIIFMPY